MLLRAVADRDALLGKRGYDLRSAIDPMARFWIERHTRACVDATNAQAASERAACCFDCL